MNIINYIIDNRIKFFIALAGVLFAVYGIDTWQYLTYNLDMYNLFNNSAIYADEPSVAMTGSFDTMRFFTLGAGYLLTVPWAFILSSLIVKAAVFYLVYNIAVELICSKEAALLASLIFLLSPNADTHGIVGNGMWGMPIFFRTSVSALLTLSGILAAIKCRYTIASILFIVSIAVHPLYGFTAFIFFASALIFYIASRPGKDFRNLMGPLFVFIVFGAYLLYVASRSAGAYSQALSTSFRDWYGYITAIQPDDIVLLWTLKKFGYFLVPILVLSGYMVYKRKTQDMLGGLYKGSLAVFSGMIFIEALHSLNVFFGSLSEYFIIAQFRRGVWVLMMFSVFIIIRYAYELFRDARDKKREVLLASAIFISAYLCPNILTCGAFLITLILLRLDVKSFLLGLVYFAMIFLRIHYMDTPTINSDVLVKTAAAIVIASLSYSITVWRKKGFAELGIMCVGLFLIFASVNGLYKNKFANDLKSFANRGLFNRPDHLSLIVTEYGKNGFKIDSDLASAVRVNNPDHKMILFPISAATRDDRFLFGAPVLINANDMVIPMFSRSAYEYFFEKVGELVPRARTAEIRKTGFNNQDEVVSYIDVLYNNLTAEHLGYLKNKYNIGIIITPVEYDSLNKVYDGEKYKVYKI